MKTSNFKYIVLILIVCIGYQLGAQDYEQKLSVPLSKPGEKGSLEVGLISGSIKVEGYNGNEVIVVAQADNKKMWDKEERNDLKGLKKIGTSAFELEIEEKNNHVTVSTSHFNKRTDLEIKVPVNFSLDLGTVNNGNIYVNNVKGAHEVNNVNGNIEMYSITGSVVASTVNGKIIVTFDEVEPNTPMAFANMNREIDITLPANTKATLKMTSKMGEVFTDFDVDLVKNDPEIKKSSESGTYKVSVSQSVTAKINGGGPDFNFKNFNGDIIVRKKK